MFRLAAVAAFGMGVLVGCPTAHAETASSSERAVARDLGYSGIEAYQAGQFALASERLEKAYAVLRVPSLGLWAARALSKQGKLLEAVERYTEVTRLEISSGDEAVQQKAQADAETELAETRKALPGVIIDVKGVPPADLTLRIDGAAVSTQLLGELTPLDPGEHRVDVQVGTHVRTRRFTLAVGAKKELVFKQTNAAEAPEMEERAAGPETPPVAATPSTPADVPAPSKPGSLQRTLGWVGVGLGAVGVAVGAVTGGLVLSKQESLEKKPGCDDHRCPSSLSSDVSSYNTLRTVSTTAFIAGGVLGGLGLVLIVSNPGHEKQTALRLSPSAVELEYRFQ